MNIQIYKIPDQKERSKTIQKVTELILDTEITNLLYSQTTQDTTLFYTTKERVGAFIHKPRNHFQHTLFQNVKGVDTKFSAVDNKQRLVLCHGNKITFYTSEGEVKEISYDLEQNRSPIPVYA